MEKKKYGINMKKENQISKIFKKLKKINVCIIGETIIDEYVYVYALGTASKDPVLSTRKTNQEKFAGGVLAVANHIAQFVDNIDLISLLGEKNHHKEFIKNHLSSNINKHFFYNKNTETIVKTRFLEEKRLTKLFKIENSDGNLISNTLEDRILSLLKSKLTNFDMVIVADFGHGFLTKKIRNYLVNNSPYLALNVQTNSSNFGFNPLSKYDSADFISINKRELQIYFQDNEYRRDDLLEKLIKTKRYKKILLTVSKEGVVYYDGIQKHTHKAFTTRPIDTVGAGDAVFSITSLLSYINEDEVIPELANIIGAIAVKTIGNKEPITKNKILNFIKD